MRGSFLVNGDHVGAGLGECLYVKLRVLDHEMHIQRQTGCLPQRRYHRNADGDIWHKMPVHHVDMQHRRSSPLDRANPFPEACEISGENRRRNFRGVSHSLSADILSESNVALHRESALSVCKKGQAIVIPRRAAPRNLLFHMKQTKQGPSVARMRVRQKEAYSDTSISIVVSLVILEPASGDWEMSAPLGHCGEG